jgi:FAD-linked sulfhydryl oxidase
MMLEFLDRFSYLYPCGQCAREFRKLLQDSPPVVTSQKAFALWLCRIHNRVNVRLGKPVFDCATLETRWQCGCVEEV